MYRHLITCFALITFLWSPDLVGSSDSSDDEAQHTQQFKTIKGLPSADDIAGNSNFDPRTIDKKLKEISHNPDDLIYPLDYVQVLAMLETYHIRCPVGYIQQLACLNQTHCIPQTLLVEGKPSDLEASARVLKGFGAQLVRQGEINSLDSQECSSFTRATYNHISFLYASSLMGLWTFPTFDTQRDLNGLPTHCFAGSLTTFYMHAGTQHYFMLPFGSFKLLVKYDTQSGDEAISKLEIEALLRSKPSSLSFDIPYVNLEKKTHHTLSLLSGVETKLEQLAKLKINSSGVNLQGPSMVSPLEKQETHIAIAGSFNISMIQVINGYPIRLLDQLIQPQHFEKA